MSLSTHAVLVELVDLSRESDEPVSTATVAVVVAASPPSAGEGAVPASVAARQSGTSRCHEHYHDDCHSHRNDMFIIRLSEKSMPHGAINPGPSMIAFRWRSGTASHNSCRVVFLTYSGTSAGDAEQSWFVNGLFRRTTEGRLRFERIVRIPYDQT